MSISWDRPVSFNSSSNLLRQQNSNRLSSFRILYGELSAAHRACVQSQKSDLNRTHTGYTKPIRTE
jgi:hypothetical protein